MPQFPSAADLLLKVPLYRSYDVSEADAASVAEIESGDYTLDAFCVDCDRLTPFKKTAFDKTRVEMARRMAGGPSKKEILRDRRFFVDLHCTRSKHLHPMFFALEISERKLRKIGQSPSMSELGRDEFKRYRKILGDDRRRELFDSTGLASQGKGIAALVYLRRVFESLLENHRVQTEAAEGPIEGWSSMRVAQRVHALQHTLPASLVEHSFIYGLLSKGVHELSDDECLACFPALREITLTILEEDFAARERTKRETALKAELQRLHGNAKLGEQE